MILETQQAKKAGRNDVEYRTVMDMGYALHRRKATLDGSDRDAWYAPEAPPKDNKDNNEEGPVGEPEVFNMDPEAH